VTGARASGVAVALRRLEALAPLARWTPRALAPAPRSEVGAMADGFGAPVIPWHAVAPGADEPAPPAAHDRRPSHRSGAVQAFTARPTPVGRDGYAPERAELLAPGTTWRGSEPQAMASASRPLRPRDVREPSIDAHAFGQRLGGADPLGDRSGATVGPPGHPIAERRPACDGSHPDRRPARRGASPGDVAGHDDRSDGPGDPLADEGAEGGAGGAGWSRGDDPDRSRRGRVGAPVDDRNDDHDRNDDRDDDHGDDRDDDGVDLPGGALGELVRRWDAPASGDRDDGGPATLHRGLPAAELRRTSEPPTASTGRSRRRSPQAPAAPAGDEHLLDVLDAALTELLRRDAERHGLEGLLP
jgi:hypothetical protein